VWKKAEEHVVKIEKEYCKENCIDKSVTEPIIIEARFVFGFRLDYKLSLFIFFFVCQVVSCIIYVL
jgi:hypothetical protein